MESLWIHFKVLINQSYCKSTNRKIFFFMLQVYVKDNDVYYLSDVTAEPLRLTSTGVEGVIFNGVPDWVYEGNFF